MQTAQNSHTELNAIQISLLRLFNRPMSEDETRDLKQLLVSHYNEQLQDEVNSVVKDKGYSQSDFDDMLNDNS
jgi:hypothetical protein